MPALHNRAAFVTLEGGERSGKSTLLAALATRARAEGREVVTAREPGGTRLGERLREALFAADDSPSPRAELLVFAAARSELVAAVIRPALARGALVLCDRFTDSTVAYQHYGRGLPLRTVQDVNTIATDGLRPDRTVLLDLDPVTSRRRGADGVDSTGGSDYIEREAAAFHQRVRSGYLALAEREPARWLVLDATAPPAVIAERAWASIRSTADIRRASSTPAR